MAAMDLIRGPDRFTVPTVTQQPPSVSSASDVDQLNKDIAFISAADELIRRMYFAGSTAERAQATEDLKALMYTSSTPEIYTVLTHLKVLRDRITARQLYLDQVLAANNVLQQQLQQQQQPQVAEPVTRVTNGDGPIIPAPGTSVTTTTETKKAGASTGAIVAGIVAVVAVGGAAWLYTKEQKPVRPVAKERLPKRKRF